MPIFRYDAYRNPYGPSIAEALQQQGQIAAAGALRAGNLQADAAQQRGAIQAHMFGTVGQAIAGIPQEMRANREMALREEQQRRQAEIQGMQLDEARRTAQSRAALEAAVGNPANYEPDGTPNHGRMLQTLRATSPSAAMTLEKHLAEQAKAGLERVETLGKIDLNRANVAEKAGKVADAEREAVSGAALTAATDFSPDQPLQMRDAANRIVNRLVADKTIAPERANQFYLQMAKAGPGEVEPLLRSLVPAAKLAEYEKSLTAGDYTIGNQRFSAQGVPRGPAVAPPLEHSPQYKEWTDYRAGGGTLDFPAYQNMDANRHRPVSITNAATTDKLISEAARNIIANPRDLTSIKTITSLRGDERLKLFNELKALDPTFNVGNIDRQIKFLDSYEDPKGRAALNRGAMNNMLMHAADLSAVNEQYRRTNARMLNRPIAVLQRELGTAWQQFATPLAVLKDEIGLYFAGGYAPSADQHKTWDQIANDTATPAQIEQFAKDIIHVGLRRADTHNEQFKTVMGYDDPNLITPQAVQAGTLLGLGDEVKKYGSGGRLGTAPAPATGATPRTPAPTGPAHDPFSLF
jgi:hypothetical protein